ncbi:MAG: hypothetical protein M3Y39_01230 [Chloroflexota bacterium]|nr:hypothetical protein [Chloroflexota bacterium]
MVSVDVLKKRIDELESLADEVEQLGIDLIQKTPLMQKFRSVGVEWNFLTLDTRGIQREAIRKYQLWYNLAYQLVKEYIPEKENEFIVCYETEGMYKRGIFDYLQLRSGTEDNNKNKILRYFIEKLETQRSIVLAVPDVAEAKELNLRKIISADIARTEIEQAEILLAGGFDRAAGSVAGVALELHLKTLCDINGLSYSVKATIQPLIQALQTARKLDITEVKHIEYLASIRNKCSHSKDVSKVEVKSLVEEVKKLI